MEPLIAALSDTDVNVRRDDATALRAITGRWERLSAGLELDVDVGTNFVGDQAQRDYGALLIGEYELANLGSAAAFPFLSARVGLMHTEVNPEESPPIRIAA